MKALERNKQTLYYALLTGEAQTVDADGLFYGYKPTYGNPVEVQMNIAPNTGRSSLAQYGITEPFDKVLVTDDVNCPITVTSVLWIESNYQTEPYDHVVVRVSKSINSVTILVRKVSASA